MIYRNDRLNKPRDIIVITDDNGDFCYPNREHIEKLYKMDSWQNKSLIKDMDEFNDNIESELGEKIHFLSDEVSKLMTRTAYR